MNKIDLWWAIKKQIQKHIWGLSKSPLTCWYDRTSCASPLHALARVEFLPHSICLTLALAPSCAALHFWCLYIMLSNPICHEDVIESPFIFINPHMSCWDLFQVMDLYKHQLKQPWSSSKSKIQTSNFYLSINIDRIRINGWNANMYHDSIVWVYQFLRSWKSAWSLTAGC